MKQKTAKEIKSLTREQYRKMKALLGGSKNIKLKTVFTVFGRRRGKKRSRWLKVGMKVIESIKRKNKMNNSYKTRSLRLKKLLDQHDIHPIRIDFEMNPVKMKLIKIWHYKLTPEFMEVLKQYELEREKHFEELNK